MRDEAIAQEQVSKDRDVGRRLEQLSRITMEGELKKNYIGV